MEPAVRRALVVRPRHSGLQLGPPLGAAEGTSCLGDGVPGDLDLHAPLRLALTRGERTAEALERGVHLTCSSCAQPRLLCSGPSQWPAASGRCSASSRLARSRHAHRRGPAQRWRPCAQRRRRRTRCRPARLLPRRLRTAAGRRPDRLPSSARVRARVACAPVRAAKRQGIQPVEQRIRAREPRAQPFDWASCVRICERASSSASSSSSKRKRCSVASRSPKSQAARSNSSINRRAGRGVPACSSMLVTRSSRAANRSGRSSDPFASAGASSSAPSSPRSCA